MKYRGYISVIAAAVVLLASCVRLEPLIEEQQQEPGAVRSMITFATDVTKAAIVNANSDTYDAGFSIFCKANNSESTCIPFNNEFVYRNNAGTAWTYDDPQYWSFSFSYYFLGMYPFKATSSNVYQYDSANNKVTVNAETGFTAGAQDDFLAGFEYRHVEKNGSAQGPVTFTKKMKHICALVEFKIMNASSSEIYDVKNASLTGLYDKGVCVVEPSNTNPSSVDSVKFAWTLNTTAGRATSGFAGDVTLEDIQASSGFQSLYSEPIIVLPQELSDDVVFSAEFKKSTQTDFNTRSVCVNTGGYTSWEAGMHYVYKIVMSSTEISITLEVNPWTDFRAGDITVTNPN